MTLHLHDREPSPNGTLADAVRANAAGDDSVSPSLRRDRRGITCYEMKFLIPEASAPPIEQWARAHLRFDSHVDAALGNAYRIHSLYLDTTGLDVYHRTNSYGRRKFRVRRYGHETGLFLERKTRSGDRVRKRRTLISENDLTRLEHAMFDPAWSAHWFHRPLHARRLQPACQITYDRVAHVASAADGPLRLTIDRRIHCAPTRAWQVGQPPSGLSLLPGSVILELKYRLVLPALFKQLIAEFSLNPRPVSKYRLAQGAWLFDESAREVG